MVLSVLGYVLEPWNLRQPDRAALAASTAEPAVYPMWTVDEVPLMDLIDDAWGAQYGREAGVRLPNRIMPLAAQFWGRLGTGYGGWQHKMHRVLALDSSPDLPHGRRSVLVCPNCGDPGCGVISATIERQNDAIVWRDFFLESTLELDEGGGYCHSLAGVGPFEFALADYRRLLSELCGAHGGVGA